MEIYLNIFVKQKGYIYNSVYLLICFYLSHIFMCDIKKKKLQKKKKYFIYLNLSEDLCSNKYREY